MARIGFGLATFAAALFVLAAPAAAAPLEAYGKLPAIEQASVSPDGAMIAVARTDGEARNVTIVRSDDQKVLVTLSAGQSKIRALTWAGSNHLLITGSMTTKLDIITGPAREWFTVIDYNIAAGTAHALLRDTLYAVPATLSLPRVRTVGAHAFAFLEGCLFVHDNCRESLFKIDLDQDKTVVEGVGWPDTEAWVIGPDGGALAAAQYDGGARRWSLSIKIKGDWQDVISIDTAYDFGGALGVGRDGRSIVIETESKDEHAQFQELDPTTGKLAEPFEVMDNADPIYDPVDERLIGLHALAGDHADYRFFAPADQATWAAAAKAFPGERVTLQSLSADHRKLVLLTDSPTEGPAYAFVDSELHKAYFIGPSYDGLKPDDIAPVQALSFKAADGLALTGYLTLPKNREPKSLPLIVFPHGGPAARDEPGFDWWAQAMASRGYAVLQVNYRGSSGFGWDFLKAGFGEWGRKMQTDLSDGVRYLAAQGAIDPKRVCIVGASYGGYAALAGPTLDPGVYRCAVSVAGPSELARLVDWAGDRNGLASQRYWINFTGAKSDEDPHLRDISPADHADRVTVPILIIHGKDDTVVPFEQSQIMAAALKRAGKPYEFVVLNHEDHWLSRGETRLQMLQATMDFLEKNNPPG